VVGAADVAVHVTTVDGAAGAAAMLMKLAISSADHSCRSCTNASSCC
jgi:hypothetical protein